MTLECHFAAGAFDADAREARAAAILDARERVAAWLSGHGLDPRRLASTARPIAVVYDRGPASGVDSVDGRLYLLWPEGRRPPLVHEWVHHFSPPPAGTPGETFLREGIATHLQTALSDDPVFPFGRADPVACLAWFGQPTVTRAAIDGDAFSGTRFDDAHDAAAARWRAYAAASRLAGWLLGPGGLAPATLFEDVLGRRDALDRLGRPIERILEAMGPVPRPPGEPPIDPAGRSWFERWSALPD